MNPQTQVEVLAADIIGLNGAFFPTNTFDCQRLITKIGDIIVWSVVSTPLKNMKVNWDDDSQYMEK